MFLKQFKYLIAVAEEGHFGRAAERCHVTQPSLSTGIKLLELEIGAPIFLRGRGQRFRGLTPEGEKVARWARSVVANCEAMREEIASMSNNLRGRLRIGAMPSMSPVLPSLLRRVRERHPGIIIDVRFIGNEDMRLGLNEFSLDVAFTYLEASDMGRRNTLPVYSERLSLLVPDTDEFRNRDSITWQETAKLPLAMLRPKLRERAFVDSMFARAGCAPDPKIESESILHLMFQVQYTELCTIIPSHFTKMPGLHTGTRALDLVDPVASQDVALFWAEGETILPMAKALVSVIRQMNKSGEFAFQLSDKLAKGEDAVSSVFGEQKTVKALPAKNGTSPKGVDTPAAVKSRTAKAAPKSLRSDVDPSEHLPRPRQPAKAPKTSGSIKPAKRADKERPEVVRA